MLIYKDNNHDGRMHQGVLMAERKEGREKTAWRRHLGFLFVGSQKEIGMRNDDAALLIAYLIDAR